MKIKSTVRKYCPFCNKHTEHKVSQVKSGGKRGSLRKGSLIRAKKRGLGRGFGNLGKYGSKPAVSSFKRTTKSSKKIALQLTCQTCKKSHIANIPHRVKRIEIK